MFYYVIFGTTEASSRETYTFSTFGYIMKAKNKEEAIKKVKKRESLGGVKVKSFSCERIKKDGDDHKNYYNDLDIIE